MTTGLVWLTEHQGFPDPERALRNPNGLLAAGGDLSPERLLAAYREGIFPWFSAEQPPLWWSPEPRAVLQPGGLHISRSMRREIRRLPYRLTTDRSFDQVVQLCAENRSDGTWILPEIRLAYRQLHILGHAHSFEVWLEDELAGGLYGVAVGTTFCGESMFFRRPNASKVAFICSSTWLFANGFEQIDCQLENDHLTSLGVGTMSREEFLRKLRLGRNQAMLWPDLDQQARTILAQAGHQEFQ